MLIHRESLELAKNAEPAGDGVPFTTSCVQVGEDGTVTVTDGLHWLRLRRVYEQHIPAPAPVKGTKGGKR